MKRLISKILDFVKSFKSKRRQKLDKMIDNFDPFDKSKTQEDILKDLKVIEEYKKACGYKQKDRISKETIVKMVFMAILVVLIMCFEQFGTFRGKSLSMLISSMKGVLSV